MEEVTLANLFDETLETVPVEEPVKSKRKELIDPRLMASINDLLKGGVIEKVCSDEQLQNAMGMKAQLAKHRLDLQDEKARINADVDFVRFKDAVSLIIDKTKALEAMEKNLGTESARYQMWKQAEADRKRREEEERVAAEKRRLAEEENRHLVKEERKRREAQELADKALAEADASKRAALIEAANAKTAEANADLKAANDAAIAVDAVAVNRVAEPAQIRGLKPRMIITAEIHNYFAAAIAILSGEDKGLLMTAAFQKAVQAAANKKAAYMGDKFALDGCSKVETPAAR